MSDDDLSGDGEQLTKREGRGAPSKVQPNKKLERGTLVGRYVVFEVVGEGGMGTVYNAYDPELDRRLAIKVVQAKPGGSTNTTGGDQARLLREAQALARLSHPNVIAVHDVGTLPGDRVFVAMELVEGVTLRSWLREPRSWRDVQTVMLAAGAGLAAAHAAGLVHRDFKPENVIVGGDGRVRVMDFGLARLAGEEHTDAARESNLAIETRSPLSANLTIDGNVVGTPAYMAPEIYDGEAADARSDQFAFGVALYEALYRMRPFEKKALVPPRDTPPVPKEPPASSAVPPALQRVVMRALSVAPGDRYRSMDELLADLAVDPSRSRRRLLMAGGAVLVLAGTLSGAVVLARSNASTTGEMCTGVERRLEGVWDTPAREAVHAAFGKSKRPFALQAMVALEKALDRYAAEWTAAATENCAATRIRGEQSEDVLALREECLDQRLGELQALARAMAKADDVTVDRAGTAEVALDPVARCANVAALREPARPPPSAQPQIAEIKARLAESKAAIVAGKILDAVAAAKKAYDTAKELGLDAQVAPAAHRYGISLFNAGKAAEAAKLLEEAAWAGVRGKTDLAAAQGALDGALVTAAGLHDPGAARVLLGLGIAIAERAGDRKLDLKRLEVEGAVAGSRGDLLAATAAHEKALALAIEVYGRDATPVAGDEQLLAATLARRGEFALALPHYERAYTLMTRLVGTDHPDAAVILTGIGSCHASTGAWKQAHDAYARALAIRERIYGPASAVLITTLNNHAELYRDEGDADAGLPLAGRARTIAETTVGKGHPFYHISSATQAELLTVAGRLDEARGIFDDIIPIAEKAASPALSSVLGSRARLAVVEQKWDDAVTFAQRSIAGFEKMAGATTPELRKPLVDLARALIAQERPADARPHLERALAIAVAAKVAASEVASIRALLK